MNRCRLIALVVLAAALGGMAQAGDTLKNLKQEQGLELWFGCTHCYGSDRYFFSFRNKGASVSVAEVSEDKDGNFEKQPLGELKLSGEDIAAFDRMLDRFRKSSSGGSTTREALSVEIWEGGKQLSKEVLVDGMSFPSAKGEMCMWDLIARLPAKKEKPEE